MVKNDDILEQRIRDFITQYAPSFHSLGTALNEAGISHYSSGCGTKSVTFDIFPAAVFVQEMLNMLSLNRPFKSKNTSGLKDVATKGARNPANDFMFYLKRWSGFAEQVMKNEGAAGRGVAAARAKLIMDDLVKRLSEIRPNQKIPEFVLLMEAIGLTLLARESSEMERHKLIHREVSEHNYHKALAIAQGIAPTDRNQAA